MTAKQTQRFYDIHRLLIKGRPVLATRLAEVFQCSEKSVLRLLNKMRNENGLPLEYDPAARTWRYTRTPAEIPPIIVNEDDRRALLVSLHSAAQFQNTPMCRQITRISQALLSTLSPAVAADFQEMLTTSVRFVGPSTPPINPAVWRTLLDCLEARETLSITYTGGHAGQSTTRTVDPYGLIMRDRHWLLIAHCHLNDEPRVFAVHRITAASSTDQTFILPPNFLDQYLAHSFDGYSSTGQLHTILLRIAKDAPAFIRDRPWHPSETRRPDPAGDLLIQFQTTALWMVQREVLADAPHVELLQPAQARQEILSRAQSLAKTHGK